jgi:hypothetical protein
MNDRTWAEWFDRPERAIREELEECARLDAERIANGTQEEFLNEQGTSPRLDWREAFFR